ncbi:MAG: cytochrome c biogenesis protein CcdA [Austwickia sp.]|nr:cytochrome c biogenesis protein CcdA [Austwickia sp.]MBK8436654.1 cytochrome c biogenesis protein CcdA [Austwickia sp.]MBK9100286.1 cytochrome c biogenesis protein CcdA [Austwickia sp.]
MGRTVATGNLALALVIAAAAGLLSFASPCVLPLVPGFLGYVTGTSTRRRSAALTGAALFVLGFSVVFLAGLALAASVGLALIEYRRELQIVGGVVVLVLAAVFLGAGGQRTLAPQWRPRTGLWGAPLLGAVFAVGWTPCSGPTLGVISVLAATDSPSLGRGLSLGAAYCLGLGVPFLLIAAGWTRVAGTGSWLRRHQRALHLSGGVLLLVVGVLLVSGGWDLLVTEIQRRLVGSFEVLL